MEGVLAIFGPFFGVGLGCTGMERLYADQDARPVLHNLLLL